MRRTAIELAEQVRSGRSSAVDIVTSHLEAIERLEPQLNAFTQLLPEAALAVAASIDARRGDGQPLGPLAGVPIGVKDLIDQANTPNTLGTSGEPAVPTADATCVARLLEADAVIVGRTGLHEYAYGFSSENHWFGPVHNPWDLDTSPGGSSGGSAAAVSAGVLPAALGTDTGGSVRVPAALCRVVGLKVSHGRVPLTGVFPLVPSVDTVGPLTRTVADSRLMYTVMAGFDPADPWSVPIETASEQSPALNKLTIGVPHPWADTGLSPDVARGWSWFRNAVTEAGATVIDIELPELTFPGKVVESLAAEVAHVHRDRFAAAPESYSPEVRTRLESTFETSIDDYLEGLEWRATLRRSLRTGFDQCNVVATPTVAAMHKTIGVDTMETGGAEVPYRLALSHFTAPVNHALVPALSLPLGEHVTGVQLIGPMWSESLLLGIGERLEGAGIASTPLPPHHF